MLLSAEHISINFGMRQLLQDVNLYVNEGDKIGIIGINGTGKSTFLKVLAGALEADEGTITRNPNLQVCYLPQNPKMDDQATVLQQVFLHLLRNIGPSMNMRQRQCWESWVLRIMTRKSALSPADSENEWLWRLP